MNDQKSPGRRAGLRPGRDRLRPQRRASRSWGLIEGGVSRQACGARTRRSPSRPGWSWPRARTPAASGLYGFRHRKGYSYDQMWIANSQAVKEEEALGFIGERAERARSSASRRATRRIPSPGTSSPASSRPGPRQGDTYPPALKAEIEERFGPYIFDVVFRTEDRDQILKRDLRHDREAVRGHGLAHRPKPWNLFMFVEIGVDRIHHAFWKYMDHGPPPLRAREQVRERDHRLLQVPRREDRPAHRQGRRRHRRPGRLRPRGEADEGRVLRQRMAHRARATWRSRSARRSRRASTTSPSTGRRPRPGPGAATTPASSSTSRAASRRASSRPRITRRSGRRSPPELVGDPRARTARPGRPRSSSPRSITRSSRGNIPTSWSISTISTGGRRARSATGRSTCPRTTPGPDDAVHAQQGIYILCRPEEQGRQGSATPTSSTSPRPSSI